MRFRSFLAVGGTLVSACASSTSGRVTLADLSVGPVHVRDDTISLYREVGPPARRLATAVVAGAPFGTWYYSGFECWMVTGWHCDQLTATNASVSVSKGVRVGMTRAQVLDVLGPAASCATRGDTLYLFYRLYPANTVSGLVGKFTADTARVFVVGQLRFIFM